MSEFKDRLVALRGYTPRAVVCAALGIKEPTYAAWEYGRNEPGIKNLARLAEYFHCSGDFLIGMAEGPNVSVSNNGDHSPVATQNASCAECPLARTVERQAALIERLSISAKEQQPR